MATLTDALKALFYQQGSSITDTGSRIALLDKDGNPAGSNTLTEVAKMMTKVAPDTSRLGFTSKANMNDLTGTELFQGASSGRPSGALSGETFCGLTFKRTKGTTVYVVQVAISESDAWRIFTRTVSFPTNDTGNKTYSDWKQVQVG